MSLLTEHLRYTPLTLLDDIINAVNEISFRLVNAAEQGLLSADPANLGFAQKASAEQVIPDTDGDGNPIYPEAKAEIEEGVHKLETLLENNVDKNFDKLELYVLRGPLHVPPELVPWVRLGHYENLTLPDPNLPASNPTADSIQRLRRQLQETRKLNAVLCAATRRNAADLELLHSLVSTCSTNLRNEQSPSPSKQGGMNGAYSFLTQSKGAQSLGITPITTTSHSKNGMTRPLETNTSFALSQLPALRALLDDLRPKLAELGHSNARTREDDAASERRLYIENQTRKVLERRGIELAGDADVTGKRVGSDELAALETIAEGLGGSSRMEE